ncbi:glycoside hydrolase family 3 protein [Sediminitomix flava]|uniref:beta-N-acetylhexosaminidase n=1 Tax=Sediminitomix flava TaxID=379075 RepID=A0A315ZI52_SEDFL|nr:glycoside hydrolase family 3 N-terminal domain-containing protein [Sediminitomix flava]PWJ44394.1 beta-glucosidase-like glycosyl hydrolase [Sediminitomix flava]
MQPPFLTYLNDEWVLETLSSMSVEEKIGQLFQVAAFSNRDEEHEQFIEELIEKYHLGGLTFFQGTPEKQIELTNKYQAKSKVPLFINIDAEWGLAMRLDGTTQFPYQMALGAIQDNELIFKMAKKIGEHCQRIGVSSALAPVVDVNNNPKNPVINYRSFGEDKEKVAEKGVAYMKGLQASNILDNAKHFPGHGDTATDSHLELPKLMHSKERLDNLELYPFKRLIDEGLSSVMTAHLEIPSLDNREHMPVTLSEKILSDLLFGELDFKGLAITDAMDMHGITNHYEDGDADLRAILAGNHIITNSKSVPKGVEKLKEALAQNILTEEQLNSIVQKVLAMKKWAALDQFKSISLAQLEKDLNDEASVALNKQLAKAAVTQLGEGDFIPLQNREKKIAVIQIFAENKTLTSRDQVAHHLKEVEKKEANILAERLQNELDNVTVLTWRESQGIEALQELIGEAKSSDEVIVSLHGVNIKPFNNFDIPEFVRLELMKNLGNISTTILLFGNAYALDEVEGHKNASTIFITYQDSIYFQDAVVDVLLGKEEANGTLPVSLSNFKAGDGQRNAVNA